MLAGICFALELVRIGVDARERTFEVIEQGVQPCQHTGSGILGVKASKLPRLDILAIEQGCQT